MGPCRVRRCPSCPLPQACTSIISSLLRLHHEQVNYPLWASVCSSVQWRVRPSFRSILFSVSCLYTIPPPTPSSESQKKKKRKKEWAIKKKQTYLVFHQLNPLIMWESFHCFYPAEPQFYEWGQRESLLPK